MDTEHTVVRYDPARLISKSPKSSINLETSARLSGGVSVAEDQPVQKDVADSVAAVEVSWQRRKIKRAEAIGWREPTQRSHQRCMQPQAVAFSSVQPECLPIALRAACVALLALSGAHWSQIGNKPR